MTTPLPETSAGNVVTGMSDLPPDLQDKIAQLVATPDEMLPAFTPVERAIILSVKLVFNKKAELR